MSREDGGETIAAIREIDRQEEIQSRYTGTAQEVTKMDNTDQARAVGRALDTPLFNDHSQGFAAILMAEEEKVKRSRVTLDERRIDTIASGQRAMDQATAAYEAAAKEIRSTQDRALLEYDAEAQDLDRVHDGIQNALDKLSPR
jgi:hypothetical protein